MNKCIICDNETTNIRNLCSHSCRLKYKWRDPEFRSKMCEIQKEVQNKPEVIEKNKNSQKERFKKNSKLAKDISKRMKIWANQNDNKSRLINQLTQESRSDKGRKDRSNRLKEKYKNEEELKSLSLFFKELWKKEEYKNKVLKSRKNTLDAQMNNESFWKARCKNTRIALNRPDVKEKISKKSIDNWNNSTYVEKTLTGGFKKQKAFKLPSGKIIKLQGYEPQALKELLNHYNENDILTSPKEISDKIGIIRYNHKDKPHRYIPDFYIISTNTIIEVKSHWTYNKNLEINLLKEKACIEKGYNFKFIVYDRFNVN
jgi:hypothetical protein